MSDNNSIDHVIPTYTAWKPGALKLARKRRMRLAWSVWVVAAAFVLFQFFLQLSSGELIAGLMKSFALTAFGGSILISSYYYIYVALQIPAGMLMDRYGPRGILSAGALVVCVGCFVLSVAKTMGIALFGRILMGAGAAFAFVGCLDVISIWFPTRRFAFMAAMVETAGMLGAIAGNFWLANFIHRVGWRECVEFAALFAGVLSVFLISIVRNAPRKKKLPAIQVVRHSLHKGLKKLLKNPVVWANGVYSGLVFGVVTVFAALWSIPFFELSHHANLIQATMTASALYVGVAVGGPILGWLDGRTLWRKTLMIITALGTSLFLFAAIFFVSLSLVDISIILFFAGLCTSSYVLTFAVANEIAAVDHRATCIGLTNTLCVVFAPLLQPVIGFVIAQTQATHNIAHFQYAVSIVPASLLVATVLALRLPPRRRGA